VLNLDAYKASHHGSDTSSSQELMGDLKPSVIVISNGAHGGFKHSRKIVLDHYDAMSPPPKVFQTNKYSTCNWSSIIQPKQRWRDRDSSD